MFETLFPLLAERSIHILLSPIKDGKLRIHIQPAQTSQKDEDVFLVPITCVATPRELDDELPELLAQWLAARASVTLPLREALAASEQALKAGAAKAAKKIEAQKTKPAAQSPATAGSAARKADGAAATPRQVARPAAASAVVASPKTEPLFD